MTNISRTFFICLLSLVWTSYACKVQASVSLTFDKNSALFKVDYGGAEVIRSNYVFWYGDWTWLEPNVNAQNIGEGYHYSFAGHNKGLGLSVQGQAKKDDDTTLSWLININEIKHKTHDIFGGISFTIDTTALKRKAFLPIAEILPGNKGWQLKLQPEIAPIKVTFSPKPHKISFENNKKSQIRVYLLKKGSQSDHHKTQQFRMTVSMPNQGKVRKSVTERLAKPSQKSWHNNPMPWKTLPIDLSFLNAHEKPAGKRGRIRAEGENLFFADGTKARFWGTNITSYALFGTPKKYACMHAKRLSRLGFNLVRIHHHDSDWVQPNIFGNVSHNTLNIDPKYIDKIDHWIKCLKNEGIYIWLDLHVGRTFYARDGIRYFAEIAKGNEVAKAAGYVYLNEDMQAKFKAFNEAYLNHINPYTKLAYKDDPAIIALLITNENDLTTHYGNLFLPDKDVPRHNKMYMAQAQAFSQKHGFNPNKTWRSWEYGPSKLLLADLEHQFNSEMISHLRKMKVKIPLVTTNFWGQMSLAGLPSLTDGDVIDVHSYGRANFFKADPRVVAHIGHWIATAHVSGKPLTVSEWNMDSFPAFDRFNLPGFMAALGSLQNWSAMIQYAYSQHSLKSEGKPGHWEAVSDPALLAMLPAAALLFRQNHVKEAHKTYALKPGVQELFYQQTNPKAARALRTLAEQSKVRIVLPEIKALPWLQASPVAKDAIFIKDFEKDFIPKSQTFVCSDTRELCRNWKAGIFTVNTELSQIAAGWLGGQTIDLKYLSLHITTPNASIAVQSRDNKPITKSESILISVAAQSVPSKAKELPYLSEPVTGDIYIKAQDGLTLFALETNGGRRKIPLNRERGAYKMTLDASMATSWFLLEKR